MDRVFAERGGTGLEHVRLEDAVRAADVSRTAAYRCWPQREDFLADVLSALAEQALPIASTRSARATGVVRAAVGDDPATVRTVEGRRAALLRAVSASADDDLLADREEDRRWRLYLTLAMAVPSLADGPPRDRVVAAVNRAEQTVRTRLAANYRRLFELFGFTSTLGYEELAEIGLALMRGYVVGGHAGADAGRPGPAYSLLAAGAAAPSDTGEWDEARGRRLLDELAAPDVFGAGTPAVTGEHVGGGE
ncbi:HTH tetR-type domain-containing protein [Tsukamurella ocularis]